MDKIYNEEGITFNDLPQAMSVMLRKVENMEQAIVGLREDINKGSPCIRTYPDGCPGGM